MAHTSSIGTGAYISIAKAMKTWLELSISFTELHLVNNRLHDKLAEKTLLGSVRDNRMDIQVVGFTYHWDYKQQVDNAALDQPMEGERKRIALVLEWSYHQEPV